MDKFKAKEFIMDLFFPQRCPLCGEVIKWDIPYCEKCYDALPATGDEFCKGCGNRISHCECDEYSFNFLRCYAAFYYEDTARNAVIYLKRTKNLTFPNIVAEKLYDDMMNDCYKFKADCIVPVPMTKRKQSVRGFNQAEVIAEALSGLLDIPVYNKVLRKHASFIAQHNLSADMRRRNVHDLYYKGDADGISGKTVILCDDVMTTGSTLNECAGLLIEMGAAAVIAAVAASSSK